MPMLSLAAALLAFPAPELHPAGRWEVEQQELGCQVTRAYAGDADVVFGFETHVTGSSVTVLVAAPKGMLPDGTGSITVTAAPAAETAVHYGAFNVADPGTRLLKLFPDQATLGAIAAAQTVQVGTIIVPVPGVSGALKALETCTSGLLTSWGADPAPWRNGKLAGFAGQPQSWFTADDGGKALPRGLDQGSVVLLVTTTAEGKPASCKAVSASDPRLEKPVCAIAMKRTQFRAPIGADGAPMASYAILPVQLNR